MRTLPSIRSHPRTIWTYLQSHFLWIGPTGYYIARPGNMSRLPSLVILAISSRDTGLSGSSILACLPFSDSVSFVSLASPEAYGIG